METNLIEICRSKNSEVHKIFYNTSIAFHYLLYERTLMIVSWSSTPCFRENLIDSKVLRSDLLRRQEE